MVRRNNSVRIRLSETEKDLLMNRAQKFGCTQSAWLRQLIHSDEHLFRYQLLHTLGEIHNTLVRIKRSHNDLSDLSDPNMLKSFQEIEHQLEQLLQTNIKQ